MSGFVWAELPAGVVPSEPSPRRSWPVQCPCGRFAKYDGDQHYYNGWFDCYRFWTICSRCGRQATECV